jgi:hypothetical protein
MDERRNARTRGLAAGLRNDLLRAFPQLQEPRYTDIANARTDQAYRYRILARDEEPVICLSIDAIVIDASNGS